MGSRIQNLYRSNFGMVPPKTNKNTFDIYHKCHSSTLLPSLMNLKKYNGKLYAIDPKSLLTARDFVILLGKGGSLTSIASKLGLLHVGMTRTETKSLICNALQAMNIAEPVLLGILKKSRMNMTPQMNTIPNMTPQMNTIPNMTPQMNTIPNMTPQMNGMKRNENGNIIARNNGTPTLNESFQSVIPKLNPIKLKNNNQKQNNTQNIMNRINKLANKI